MQVRQILKSRQILTSTAPSVSILRARYFHNSPLTLHENARAIPKDGLNLPDFFNQEGSGLSVDQ